MSDEAFKCGCEAGYRDVVTGDLKGYALGAHGVALEIAMDPCGTMYLGSDHDETWAKANKGKHLAITITQFPNQGPQVIDIGLLEGRASDQARKAARLGLALGVEIRRTSAGEWHAHLPKDHPMIPRVGGRILPFTDEMLDTVDARIEQLKRDQGT